MMETPPPSPSVDPLRRRPLRRILRNWLERHQDPFNFWIHLVGIPLAVAGVVLWFIPGWWLWGIIAFALGYALQYVGHRVEGNDVGEWAAIKRLLGMPYVSIAPRFQTHGPNRDASRPDPSVPAPS
jgi:hypothetical protein